MKTTLKFSEHIYSSLIAFVVILTSLPLQSQTFSNEEQELIDHITNCWDAWIEAKNEGNPEIWYEKCPSKPDASFWWTEEGAPEQTTRIRNRWSVVMDLEEEWLDIRPVAVRIWDEIGMVQFYGYWRAMHKGESVITEFKRTEMFKNENGTWILLGGQGTPAAKEDAEPYR